MGGSYRSHWEEQKACKGKELDTCLKGSDFFLHSILRSNLILSIDWMVVLSIGGPLELPVEHLKPPVPGPGLNPPHTHTH